MEKKGEAKEEGNGGGRKVVVGVEESVKIREAGKGGVERP